MSSVWDEMPGAGQEGGCQRSACCGLRLGGEAAPHHRVMLLPWWEEPQEARWGPRSGVGSSLWENGIKRGEFILAQKFVEKHAEFFT